MIFRRKPKRFVLIGADGRRMLSRQPGTLGGNRRTRIYGRLDCRVALRHVANGTYGANRVFFADARAAEGAGYRACKICMAPARQPRNEREPHVL